MKNLLFCLFITILFQPIPVTVIGQTSENINGNWRGKLNLPGSKLEIIFRISADENGKLTSKMDVPLQGAKDLPVSETVVANDSLNLTVAMIMGRFSGKITSDSTIEGTWKQSGASLPLVLKKTRHVTELKRPQTPEPPFPYSAEEVEYLNPISGFKLAGTLTLPENTVNCPAVILISGSGAQDRDETIFGHKPFRVIADYLTRNGIAVLRFDDRGVGSSEGTFDNATSEDFAGDVLAGVNFLKSRKEISAAEIGLIGHSEGGLIAPMVAGKTNDIAFVVLLAAPGINGEQLLYSQAELLNRAAGLTDEQVQLNRNLQKDIFEVVINETDSLKQTGQLRQLFSNGMYDTLDEDQKKIIETRINGVNSPWFRYFLTYEPHDALVNLNCPVLVLNGSKDLQVPPKENLEAIENALKNGGNKNFKIMELENLNHLFQTCETGTVAEYAQIEETFSIEVLEILRDWILNSGIKN